MTKNTSTDNVWDDSFDHKATVKETPAKVAKTQKQAQPTPPKAIVHSDFDIEGLMTDFPTAKDLERFVFDETGIVLNLKGRANKVKYEVAMNVLNGEEVDLKFIGGDNPYIEKAEMIPEEELKPTPARSKDLPPKGSMQNAFYSPLVPHPDEEQRAQDKKVDMIFRKYDNGMISYEILGPLEQKPFGEKINKYGKTVPEIIKWIDPRTGEQTVMREDGTLTPQGKRLRAMMQTFKVNKSNQWEVWIDREFISVDDSAAHNPWSLDK
jgi:hypothetical protein